MANTQAIKSVCDDDDTMIYAMKLATASVLPLVLRSTIELGILDVLDEQDQGAMLSASQIASKLKTSNPEAPSMIDHMMCLLASHAIVTCSVEADVDGGSCRRLYGLAPVAKYFTRNHDQGSLRSWVTLTQEKVILDAWFDLKDAVIEGGFPFERTHGTRANSYFMQHPTLHDNFMSQIKDYSKLIMRKLLESYRGFEGLNLLVDVGGGDGSVLHTIISKYPSMKGINYDLPSVIEKCPSYTGITHIAGDMISSVPKGDAILMKWVIHFWDDEHCLKVFKNCYAALPDEGKVMVMEMVMPDPPEVSSPAQNIFQMNSFIQIMNPRRIERTAREFENLARGAGFSGIRVVTCGYNYSVIELLKKK